MPPESIINQRYRVLRNLGEGGMATVYLVRDQARDGRLMALKRLRDGLVDEEAAGHLKAEFENLTRLTHPHLAEVYDMGLIEGTGAYFFTQEFIQGANFFEATRGTPPNQLYALVTQICRVLEYIHSRDLIHHDLKPTNIMVSNEEAGRAAHDLSKDDVLAILASPFAYNTIKLLDFGLAAAFVKEKGRTRIKGSVHYIAPEVAKGTGADARADLYSLGVTLYHVATGQVPFDAGTSLLVIRKHIEEKPPAPSSINPKISPGLEQIILKLMAKDPAERYARAADVIMAINKIAGREFEIETRETKRGYVLSAKFVGRDKELTALRAGLDDVNAKKHVNLPAFTLISGEAGIGKSRLLRELRIHCQLQNVAFAEGNGYERTARAYGLFLEILKQVIGFAHAKGRLARYGPELVKLLPDFAEAHGITPSATLEPREEHLRLVDNVANFLLDVARDRTLVLCLNDLHLADQGSLELLRYLAGNLALQRGRVVTGEEDLNRLPRLFLVGATRVEEDGPLASLAREMEAEGTLSTTRLARFGVDGVRNMVRGMFGEVAGLDAFADRITVETGGNPFFVQEVMMTLVDKGVITHERGRWEMGAADLDAIEIPKTIEEVVHRRLSGLTGEESAILRALAVIERPADGTLLGDLAGVKDSVLGEALRALERKGFVLREEGAQGTAAAGHRLAHATIQKVVYAGLSDAARRTLHRRMGETLERSTSLARAHIEELARHFLRAGEPERGIKYGLEAGRELMRIYANDQALALFQGLLGLDGLPDAAVPEIAALAGEIHRLMGRFDDSLAMFEKALAKLDAGDPKRGQVYAQMANIFQIKGDNDRFSDAVSRAKEIFTNSGDRRGLGMVYSTLGEIFYQRTEYEKALRYANVSIGIAEGIGDKHLLCRALGNVGLFYRMWSQYDEAIRFFQKSIKIAEEVGHKDELIRGFGNMGIIQRARGQYEEATEFTDKQMRLAVEIGDKRRIGTAYGNLAGIAMGRGDFDEAMRHYEKSLRIAEEIRDKGGVGHALAGVGLIQVLRGEYEQAAPCLNRAAQIAMEVSDRWLLGSCLGATGILHYSQGDYGESKDCLVRSLEIFEEGGIMDGILEVSHWLCRLYLTMGDATGARSAGERALTISRNRGMKSHEARYLGCMATVERRSGNLEAAGKCLELADEIRAEARSKDERAYHRTEEVFALLEDEEHEKAKEAARKAVAESTKLGVRLLLCRAYLAQGLALVRGSRDPGVLEEARESLERARELAVQIKNPEFLWQVHGGLAEVYRKRNNPLKAGFHCDEVKQVFLAVNEKLPEEYREAYLKDPRRRAVLDLIDKVSQEVESRKDETATLATDFAATGAERWLTNLVRDHAGAPVGRDVAQLARLIEVSRRIGGEGEPRKVLEYITDTAIELTGADRGFLILRGGAVGGGAGLRFEVSRNLGSRDIDAPAEKVSKGLAERVMDGGEIVLTGDAPGDKRLQDLGVADLRVKSIVCVPIRMRGQVAGALYLDSLFTEKAFAEREAALLTILTDQAAVALENARLHQSMVVERVTGAFVPAYVDGILERELDRCKRYGRLLSILRVDLDRFQVINDFHGAEAGNEILREVCGILRKGIRNVDVLGRGAADEFDVVLPETERAEALRLANRLRTEIATWPFQSGGRDVNVTVSVGVLCCPQDAGTLTEVRERLNEAVYNAKRNGRNSTFTFEAGVAGERDVQRKVAEEADIDRLVVSRDGITVLGMLMKVINAGLDLDKVLALTMQMMIQVTRAERGFIMLRGNDGKFKPVTALNFKDEEITSPQFEFSSTIVEQVARTGEAAVVTDALAESQFRGQDSIMDLQIRSILSVPIKQADETIGVVYMDNQSGQKRFTDEDRELLLQFAGKIAGPIENSRQYARTKEEADFLKRTLTTSLEQLRTKYSYGNILGQSKPMRELFKLLDKITETHFPVIVHGESGTGKELVAKAVHFNGPRKDKPFVAENCGALTETLLESELFGHVRGAFTGADRDKEGMFAFANGGTLFLDEIGEMGLEMQKKLLRVLQEGEIRQVGGKKSIKVDVRIIAATHRDLRKMVGEGSFREDLYYRLNVFTLNLPSLRERRDDIPMLVEHFLEKYAAETGGPKRKVPRDVMRRLVDFDWPGNIRQLENEVKRLLAFADAELTLEDLSPDVKAARGSAAAGSGKGKGGAGAAGGEVTEGVGVVSVRGKTYDQIIASVYQAVLEDNDGSVEKAAKALGLARSTFYYRLKEAGIGLKKGKG